MSYDFLARVRPRQFINRKSEIIYLSLAVFVLSSCKLLAQLDHSLPPAEQAAAGQALAEKWRDAIPEESAEYKGALKSSNRDDETQTVPLTFKIITGEPSWQTIYEAAPTAKTAGEKLIIIHTPGKPNQYLHAKGSKPGEGAGQPREVKNEQAAVPFAGSDFWLIDLGLEFFHWPTQRLVRTEMRKGQVTKVLESINAHPAHGYGRVVTWLEKESGAPVVAEAHDSNDKPLKEFSIKSVKKVKGRYQLQEMKIRNLKTDSRTWIEYDLQKE